MGSFLFRRFRVAESGRGWVVFAALFAAFALDQVSKHLILTVVMQPPRIIPLAPFLNLTLGFNTGVSFGLFRDVFANAPHLLSGLKLILTAGFLVGALTVERRVEGVGFALIAGGALGNILDRVRSGAVTDFIDVHLGGWHWPTFNLADVAITLGVFALIWGAGTAPSPSVAARRDHEKATS